MNSSVSKKSLLIEKYNVPGPRYTSYPTVPYWEPETFTSSDWTKHVSTIFAKTNSSEGISLYIHLPYCESLCTYCGCNTRITVNHLVEVPYINAVLQEWELYKRIFGRSPHIKQIHLGGGTPTFFSPENLFNLMDGILSGCIISDEAEFSFEGHPGNTSYEHLKVLYGIGFRRVSFGVQDFDIKVQEAINRYQTFEEVQRVTQWSREIGYTSVNYDLVYGLPLQTELSVSATISKVLELRPDRIAFYSYAHVPWIKPGQRKFTELDLPSDIVKRKLYEDGRNQLEATGYFEIGMDHFALPEDSLYKSFKNKTMHRNFMGYTSSRTSLMIGLGASSISDSWTAFAQNAKTVEEYMKEVNNANLPVFRGHILNEEDLVLRKHISNIMCTGETDWSNEADQCTQLEEVFARLEEMKEDELIIKNESSLKITKEGEPFVRNICMAFDSRMHSKESKKQIFSKVI